MDKIKPKRKSGAKKQIQAMYPVKIWLTQPEACSYMDMCVSELKELVSEGRLTVSARGRKIRYRVDELNKTIEEDIIIRKIK